MRDNSEQGDAENNLRDPTLKEHEAEGAHRQPTHEPGEEAEIGGSARAGGEDPSPDDARGETSRADNAPPTDPYPKSE
ncbi:MAG: hypothetical protein K0R64_2927 [Novosphingobium lindaniclasticum]|jgi:hypothetical protein|uniref:hypothetical protein n=1 Tax=Novosphingobium lindaniclasticum TaxID=1329895 RepID=UPI00240A0B7C|nr:hypothetical protein [Novosphingobium lindaniclasticum]MDF2639943.1 hypothetical protein [Novosphingobium lindaniclasticum]